MLFKAHVPPTYWSHAFQSAVYIINRLPSSVLGERSPFEVLFHAPPSYAHFRPFGCRVYPYLRDYADHKLSPRSLPCVFLGYCSQYKGFQCLEPTTSHIFVSRHARFDEQCFPFDSEAGQPSVHMLALSEFCDAAFAAAPSPSSSPAPAAAPATSPSSPSLGVSEDFSPHVAARTPDPSNDAQSAASHGNGSEGSSSGSDGSYSGSDDPDSSADDTDSDDSVHDEPPPEPASPVPPTPSPRRPPPPSHPMITRAKAGIFKPRYRADFASTGLVAALHASTDPRGFKTASRHPHWLRAMQDELDALKRNNTFVLVPRPVDHNVVGCKWIFRTKYLADGSIDRHKARLVAQGFSQVPGLDFSHTFSPVVKAATVRVVLSLAVAHKWRLHQLDINNAFLNGHLTGCVYMEQPPGFEDPRYPNHVCRLDKALYGLKQAPRAWFHRLSTFLVANGFTYSRADPSLFVFRRGTCIMYLLVYVDDLILTGNQPYLIQSFITKLNAEFAIKDLGQLSYFLGLEVTYTKDGLFLSQSKYALDILKWANMVDAKSVTTPLAANAAFVTSGDPFDDPTTYRSLVGALQYLTITRPDISYAVNQVSQFLQAPTLAHFQSVKRILRYIKGTLSFGLTFSHRTPPPALLGYSDADWARCLETRRSTYGYSIFLGGNLVSWSAKKQPTISRSSCESEYRAMANTAAEIVWVTHLLRELHVLPPDRPTLLCDNQSAIFLSQNPISHKRAKHIDIDYHFVRELVSSGKLYTRFVPTKLQLADIFTKSLPQPLFAHFRAKLRIGPPPFRLRGV